MNTLLDGALVIGLIILGMAALSGVIAAILWVWGRWETKN